MKRDKNRAKNGSLRNTSADSKGATCLILQNDTNVPSTTLEKIESIKQSEGKASPNKFGKKIGMLDSAENFREVDDCKDHTRAWLEFVKLIRNA